ncbi:MAG: hypothetical protein K6D97_03855 [Clostridia bacterium]|nr:hypothetical protein [Clostridia bacterium]
MDDITLERLQTEFDEVISQIDDIVARKDIASARKVLEQVAELVSNDEHVPLDDVEGYDHILHKLLDNIHGVIEIAEIAPNDPELQALIDQRKKLDDEIGKINSEIDALKKTDGNVVIEVSERNLLINRIQHQITRLRKRTEEPGLSQEEIERLTAQITELEEYHRELLSIEYTYGSADTSEIDKQIADKEKEIADLEKKISELGNNDGRTPGEETRANPEIMAMINQIRDLRIRIASNDADIDENYPGYDEMDTQEIQKRIEDSARAQEELDQVIARLREVSPEALELVTALNNANDQLAKVDDNNTEERNRLEKVIADLEKRISEFGGNSRRTPDDEVGFSPEVIAMVNQIRDLRIRIASDEADIDENYPGYDEMDAQERQNRIEDRVKAQEELDQVIARLREVSPEALELSNALNSAIDQLAEADANNTEERNRLEQEIERLRGLLRIRVPGGQDLNQERINELTNQIKQLEKEIQELTRETEGLQHFLDGNESNEIVVGDGVDAQGFPPVEEQVKKLIEQYEASIGIKLDSSMYEVIDDGSNGNVAEQDSFDESIGTRFKLIIHRDKVQAKLNELRNQIEGKNKERADYEKELDDLQNGRGGSSNQKKKLEEDLANKKKELEDLKKQKESMSKKGDKTKVVLERESYIKMLEIKIKYLKMKLETAKKSGRTKEIEKMTQEISTIEIQIKTIRTERTDNSDRIDELTKKKEGLESQRAEIDEKIKKLKDEKGIAGDRLDLEEEAHKIGDKIFKTAEIRKELESRGYTRDDFLSFYEQGREKTHQRISQLAEEASKIEADMVKEMGEILHDDETGVGLHKQLEAANGNDAERIKIYEKMRKNFISSGREEWLTKAGITGEITSKEGADALEALWNGRLQQYKEALQFKKTELEEHKQNLRVFDREIERINKEKEVVQISQGNVDSFLESANKEKELRKKQLRATMYGDPEIEKEWDERIARFISHKKAEGEEITYTDENGEQVTVKVDTIEDYPELKEDAYFLNLEDYKAYTEITSLYDKKGLAAVKAVIDMSGHEFDEYRSLVEAGQTEAADKWLEDLMAAKKEYIKTYHGFTNKHAVKAAVLRTAGSTLEQMLPVTGNLPLQTKMKNGLVNVGRFMMIRVPKFSREDSEGNKVTGPAEIAGGVLTTAADLAVIGGLGFAAFTGGLAGLVPAAFYYGARGVVTLGNVIAGRHVQNKYSEEIKNNVPTLAKASSRDKEVARRAYYRDAEKMSGIRSFFRAKLDKLPFFSKRASETEEKILKRQGAAIDATVDTRVDNIIIDSKENAKVAEQNQKVRVERQKAEIKSAGTYNDIVRDPDSLDKAQAAATIAQNAAVKAERPGARSFDVNPTSTVERKDKYTKEEVEYGRTGDLREIKTEGGTATVASITEEQKHKAAKERQDLINAVSTIVVAGALKGAYDFFKDGLHREVPVKDPNGTKEVVKRKPVDKEVGTIERQKFRKETVTEVDGSKKLSDYNYTDKTRRDTYDAPFSDDPVSRGTDYDAVAFRWEHNGKQGELSMAESGSGFRVGHGGHVQYSTNMKIQDGSIADQLQELSRIKPEHYQRMLRENGLDGAPIEDVVKAVENGKIQMYTQTSKLEGWGQYLDGAVKQSTIDVPDGIEVVPKLVRDYEYEVVKVPDPNAVKYVTKSILDPEVAIEAAKEAAKGLKEGLIIGAAGTAIDTAENIGSPTQHMHEGTFDRRTSGQLRVSQIADKAVDAYNRKHGLGKYANGRLKEDTDDGEHDENPDDERQ